MVSCHPAGTAAAEVSDYRPSRITDELINMMAFDVIGDGDDARYLIVHEGERLTVTYGNDYPERDRNATRFLDDASARGAMSSSCRRIAHASAPAGRPTRSGW